LGVRMGDVIWGKRQFQAKMPNYKNNNISETINPIKTKCED